MRRKRAADNLIFKRIPSQVPIRWRPEGFFSLLHLGASFHVCRGMARSSTFGGPVVERGRKRRISSQVPDSTTVSYSILASSLDDIMATSDLYNCPPIAEIRRS